MAGLAEGNWIRRPLQRGRACSGLLSLVLPSFLDLPRTHRPPHRRHRAQVPRSRPKSSVDLGYLAPFSVYVGPSWPHVGLSWPYLGPILGHFGPILAHLGPILVHLGSIFGLLASIFAHVGLNFDYNFEAPDPQKP